MFVLRGLLKRRHLGPVFWDLSTATLKAEARASLRSASVGAERVPLARSTPEKQIYQCTRPDGLIMI